MRYVRILVSCAVVVWCAHAASRPLTIRIVTVVEAEVGRAIPGMSIQIVGERIVSMGGNTRPPKDGITLDASGHCHPSFAFCQSGSVEKGSVVSCSSEPYST
jgi:hypothetical protein